MSRVYQRQAEDDDYVSQTQTSDELDSGSAQGSARGGDGAAAARSAREQANRGFPASSASSVAAATALRGGSGAMRGGAVSSGSGSGSGSGGGAVAALASSSSYLQAPVSLSPRKSTAELSPRRGSMMFAAGPSPIRAVNAGNDRTSSTLAPPSTTESASAASAGLFAKPIPEETESESAKKSSSASANTSARAGGAGAGRMVISRAAGDDSLSDSKRHSTAAILSQNVSLSSDDEDKEEDEAEPAATGSGRNRSATAAASGGRSSHRTQPSGSNPPLPHSLSTQSHVSHTSAISRSASFQQIQSNPFAPHAVQSRSADTSYIHTYRISVDLRSIRDLSHNYNVFLRYNYPLFGDKPVLTRPPTAVPKHTECLLPQSFRAFEVLLGEEHLAHAFQSDPLIVEVFHHDKFAKDTEIGIVKLNLSGLLAAPKHQTQAGHSLQLVDNFVSIYGLVAPDGVAAAGASSSAASVPSATSAAGFVKRGSLRVILSLEDLGATSQVAPPLHANPQYQQPGKNLNATAGALSWNNTMQFGATTAGASAGAPPSMSLDPTMLQQAAALNTLAGPQLSFGPFAPSGAPLSAADPALGPDPRIAAAAAAEYAIAWELEAWKRAEQVKQEAKWKETEAKRMAQLEEEWCKQETAREELFAKKHKEIIRLEAKLKEALFDVEKQEKKLRLGEDEIAKVRSDAARELEQQKQDMALTIRRLREQHKHEIALVQQEAADMKKENERFRAQAAAATAKRDEAINELQAYRHKINQSDLGHLRIQMAEREATIRSLNEKLHTANETLSRSKEQLLKSLKEISRLKSLREAEQQSAAERDLHDMQRSRLQFLAKQHQGGLRQDRDELETIKHELQRLATGGTLSKPPAIDAPLVPPPRFAAAAVAAAAGGTTTTASSVFPAPASAPTGFAHSPRAQARPLHISVSPPASPSRLAAAAAGMATGPPALPLPLPSSAAPVTGGSASGGAPSLLAAYMHSTAMSAAESAARPADVSQAAEFAKQLRHPAQLPPQASLFAPAVTSNATSFGSPLHQRQQLAATGGGVLSDISNTLHNQLFRNGGSVSPAHGTSWSGVSKEAPASAPSRAAELQRLEREKQQLMQGGAYAEDHPIIVELSRRIERL